MKSERTATHLGPGGKLYVVIASLVLVLDVYVQNNLLYFGFGLMVGGFTASVVVALMMMRHVSVQRIAPGHGVVDQPLALRYRVTNGKRILPMFGLVVGEIAATGDPDPAPPTRPCSSSLAKSIRLRRIPDRCQRSAFCAGRGPAPDLL